MTDKRLTHGRIDVVHASSALLDAKKILALFDQGKLPESVAIDQLYKCFERTTFAANRGMIDLTEEEFK